MTIASELLHRHLQTLVEDHAQWQTLIADDLVWELPYAPAIGYPMRLSGRDEVVRHVTWFLGAYVLFLRAAGGKIAFLREYFNPVRAAKALETPVLGLES